MKKILFAALVAAMLFFGNAASAVSSQICSGGRLDLAFVLDSSNTMDQEWATLCNYIQNDPNSVVRKLEDQGIEVNYKVYSIGFDRGNSCIDDSTEWHDSSGLPFRCETDTSGDPFYCRTSATDNRGSKEAWSPALQDVIYNKFPWSAGESAKIIIVVSDNNPSGFAEGTTPASVLPGAFKAPPYCSSWHAAFKGCNSWYGWRNFISNGTKEEEILIEDAKNAALGRGISVFFMHPPACDCTTISECAACMENPSKGQYGDPAENDAVEAMEEVAFSNGGLVNIYSKGNVGIITDLIFEAVQAVCSGGGLIISNFGLSQKNLKTGETLGSASGKIKSFYSKDSAARIKYDFFDSIGSRVHAQIMPADQTIASFGEMDFSLQGAELDWTGSLAAGSYRVKVTAFIVEDGMEKRQDETESFFTVSSPVSVPVPETSALLLPLLALTVLFFLRHKK